MTRSILLLAGMFLSLLQPLTLQAADVTTPECVSDVYGALAKEQRMFRSVVYGEKKAEDLPVNSLLYDKEGKTWIKTERNRWTAVPDAEEKENQNVSPGNTSTKSDDQMDDERDTPVRRGLLQARRTATSDLIPPITQSLRALQCKLRSICELAIASQFAEEDEDELTVQPAGCEEVELPPLRSCNITDGVSPSFADPGACDRAAYALFQQENNLLSLSVSYDASYRTIAQFSGMFEGFLSEFRFPLLNPLWQTVRTLGGLKNIPCFLSQCEE